MWPCGVVVIVVKVVFVAAVCVLWEPEAAVFLVGGAGG